MLERITDLAEVFMAIHVLDKHIAELIAAGEVVERPASVVKELVENAIDAGARSVSVEIQRGGIELISVQDDGGGIAAEDIPLAFVRHATSKVREAGDLDSIGTLGFRGEALASIASVARVELLTRTEQDEFASLYRIEGGEERGIEAAARPVGTTIKVLDLFYNTPARMKFLKKDASEATFVSETVTRQALGHPEIAVSLSKDGKRMFATPGDGRLDAAVYAVLGREFAKDLIPAEGGSRQYSVRGLVTRPRAGRASRAMQFFYINGRFVKNRTMMAALEQAYRGMMMQGRFPGCVLCLDMPAELVDVNVHPAKTEVRFARESDVFDAVYTAVKGALAQSANEHSSLRLDGLAGEGQAAKPAQEDTARHTTPSGAGQAGVSTRPQPRPNDEAGRIRAYNQMVEILASDSSFAPYTTRRDAGRSFDEAALRVAEPPAPEQTPEKPEAEGQHSAGTKSEDMAQQLTMQPEEEGATVPLRLIGEVFRTYILAEAEGRLCVIDKHAAHERILYEKLAAQRGGAQSQQLLAPVTVMLSAKEKNAILENSEALAAVGLEAEDFGAGSVLVRGVPADIAPDSVADLAVEIAGRLALNSRDTLDEKTEWVLHSVACRAAIKGGDKTHPQELLRLAQDIISGAVPPFCPHGRPVVLEITHKELEKQFGRLG